MEKTRAQRLTPVELAFIGDAVHTLYVRERVVSQTDVASETLHIATCKLVNARCQAAVFDELVAQGIFNADETDVARRAKNAHLHSRAKGATIGDYHKATALEAVIGYIHVSGDTAREKAVLELCCAIGEKV